MIFVRMVALIADIWVVPNIIFFDVKNHKKINRTVLFLICLRKFSGYDELESDTIHHAQRGGNDDVSHVHGVEGCDDCARDVDNDDASRADHNIME